VRAEADISADAMAQAQIVVTLLSRVDSCGPYLDPVKELRPLKESVVIERAD
jgi:hypothetical protein